MILLILGNGSSRFSSSVYEFSIPPKSQKTSKKRWTERQTESLPPPPLLILTTKAGFFPNPTIISQMFECLNRIQLFHKIHPFFVGNCTRFTGSPVGTAVLKKSPVKHLASELIRVEGFLQDFSRRQELNQWRYQSLRQRHLAVLSSCYASPGMRTVF